MEIVDQTNPLIINMVYTTSTGWTSYQGCVSNSGRVFVRGRGKFYSSGRDRVFNLNKLKVWGECKSLGCDVYFIVDVQQLDKYTNTKEAILNYIEEIFNEGNYVKELLEELTHLEFNIIKPKTPDSIPFKGSVKEMIFI